MTLNPKPTVQGTPQNYPFSKRMKIIADSVGVVSLQTKMFVLLYNKSIMVK